MPSGEYYPFTWKSTDVGVDGVYEVRARTDCDEITDPDIASYQEVKQVRVDFHPPEVFGVPTPGIRPFYPGDPLQVTFSETIDCDSGTQVDAWVNVPQSCTDGANSTGACSEDPIQPEVGNRARLSDLEWKNATDLGVRVLLQYRCVDNVMSLALSPDQSWEPLTGQLISVSVDNVFDLASNRIKEPVRWSFEVASFDVASSLMHVSGSRLAMNYSVVTQSSQDAFETQLTGEIALMMAVQLEVEASNVTNADSLDVQRVQQMALALASRLQITQLSPGSILYNFDILPAVRSDVSSSLTPSALGATYGQALSAGLYRSNATLLQQLSLLPTLSLNLTQKAGGGFTSGPTYQLQAVGYTASDVDSVGAPAQSTAPGSAGQQTADYGGDFHSSLVTYISHDLSTRQANLTTRGFTLPDRTGRLQLTLVFPADAPAADFAPAAWSLQYQLQADLVRDDLDAVGSEPYPVVTITNAGRGNTSAFYITQNVAAHQVSFVVFGLPLKEYSRKVNATILSDAQMICRTSVVLAGLPPTPRQLSCRQVGESHLQIDFTLGVSLYGLANLEVDVFVQAPSSNSSLLIPSGHLQVVSLAETSYLYGSPSERSALSILVDLSGLDHFPLPPPGSSVAWTFSVSLNRLALASELGVLESVLISGSPAAISLNQTVLQTELTAFEIAFIPPASALPITRYRAGWTSASDGAITWDDSSALTLRNCTQTPVPPVSQALPSCLTVRVPLAAVEGYELYIALEVFSAVGSSTPQLRRVFPFVVLQPASLTVTQLAAPTDALNLLDTPLTIRAEWSIPVNQTKQGLLLGYAVSITAQYDDGTDAGSVQLPGGLKASRVFQLPITATSLEISNMDSLANRYSFEIAVRANSTDNHVRIRHGQVSQLESQPTVALLTVLQPPPPVAIVQMQQLDATSIVIEFQPSATADSYQAVQQVRLCNFTGNSAGLIVLSGVQQNNSIVVDGLVAGQRGAVSTPQFAVQARNSAGWSHITFDRLDFVGVPNAPELVRAYQLVDQTPGVALIRIHLQVLGFAPVNQIEYVISGQQSAFLTGTFDVPIGTSTVEADVPVGLNGPSWLLLNFTATNVAGTSFTSSFEIFLVSPAPFTGAPPNCCRLRLANEYLPLPKLNGHSQALTQLDAPSIAWLAAMVQLQGLSLPDTQLQCTSVTVTAWTAATTTAVPLSVDGSSLFNFDALKLQLLPSIDSGSSSLLQSLTNHRMEMQLSCAPDVFVTDNGTVTAAAATRRLLQSSESCVQHHNDCARCVQNQRCGYCKLTQSCMARQDQLLCALFDSWVEGSCTSVVSSSSTGAARSSSAAAASSTGPTITSSSPAQMSSTAAHGAASSTAAASISPVPSSTGAATSSSSSSAAPAHVSSSTAASFTAPRASSSSSTASVKPISSTAAASPVVVPDAGPWWEQVVEAYSTTSAEPIWGLAPVHVRLESSGNQPALKLQSALQAGFAVQVRRCTC